MHLPFASVDINVAWPFLIPIVAMFIPIVAIITSYCQRRDLLHAWHHQRMAAIEKGIELPPMPPEMSGALTECRPESQNKPENHLLGGMVLIAVGCGAGLLLHALRTLTGFDYGVIGAIPAFIGVALVLYYFAIRNKAPAQNR